MTTATEKLQAAGLAVVAPKTTALAVPIAQIEGVEGMDGRDINIPRIQLLQEKATLLKNMRKAGVTVNAGVFVSSANETVPLASVEFVPAYMTKFWDLYEIQGEKKKWLSRTFNQADPSLAGKRTKSETVGGVKLKAEVYEVITAVVVIDGFPAIINFKFTSYTTGKDLHTKAFASKKPLWAQKYKLGSKEAQDQAGNDYFVMTLEVLGPSTEEEQAVAQQVYQSFKGRASTKLNTTATAAEGEDTPF